MILVHLKKDNTIFIPKGVRECLNIKNEEKLVLKCTCKGMIICKPNAFDEIDLFFESLDEDLKKLWGLKMDDRHK